MRKRTLHGMSICVSAGLLVLALPQLAGAFPGRSGGCYNCHNDGSGSLLPSPDPMRIKIGENGLLTFDVTALPEPNGNNMIALEDLSIAALDASIGAGGDVWTLGTTATKSSQNIGLGPYVLDLVIGANALLGTYELDWRLAGGGLGEPKGTTGKFTVRLIPEPAALALTAGFGLAGLAAMARRARRRRESG